MLVNGMNVEELLNEALESYIKGNVYDSVLYLETVLEMEEGNYKALTLLSKIYSDAGFYSDALKYSEISYKKYSDNLETIFNMGYLYQSMGRYRKALSYYRIYMDKEEDYHILLNMGLCYMEMKYFKKALSLIEKAISKEPLNSEGYMDKAECLVRMKEYEKAMEIYEERLKNRNNNIEDYYIYMRMADLKSIQGEIEEAIKFYNIAINFENSEDFVYESFYEMLIREDKREEIEILLMNLYSSNIPKEKVLNLEGRYASEIKDFVRAKKVCEKLLLLDPGNPQYYLNSAYVLEMLGKYDEALKFIYRAEKYVNNRDIIKNLQKRIKKLKNLKKDQKSKKK